MAHAIKAPWPQGAELLGLMVTNTPERPAGPRARIEIVEATHPVPDASGTVAALPIETMPLFEATAAPTPAKLRVALNKVRPAQVFRPK